MVTNRRGARKRPQDSKPRFAAIDLGTNNCRLLIASPTRKSFRVEDSFSRIVRLGEGVDATGRLSDAAMERTIKALRTCASKMNSLDVHSSRCIATQACRAAANGQEFLDRVAQDVGIELEIVSAETEAALSVRGCRDLIDPVTKAVLVFDIGGGSTEISWVRVSQDAGGKISTETAAWTSLPLGVVTLAERHSDPEMSPQAYAAMADDVANMLMKVDVPDDISEMFDAKQAHLIGTSGTVTSLAGVHLNLKKYSRSAVDGIWMSERNILDVSEHLRLAGLAGRAQNPCIGKDRADLVVPGCAILSGMMKVWPASRVRVGDRGLREGLLMDLIENWRRETKAAQLSTATSSSSR